MMWPWLRFFAIE